MKKHILKILSVLSLAFFFFPFFSVSYGYKEITFSGLDLATGRNGGEFIDGHYFIFLLLLLPIALLGISFYAKKRERIAALTTSSISTVVLLAISIIVASTEKNIGFDATTKSGYFLYLLSIVASVGYILYEYLLKNPVTYKKATLDFNDKVLEFGKIRNLFVNDIYSEEEFSEKKSTWIDSLSDYSFTSVEMDFLSGILPFVKENLISQEELSRIKYLISEEYVETRKKSSVNQKLANDESVRTQRQEIFGDFKDKAKNGIGDTISKMQDGINRVKTSAIAHTTVPTCKCGERIDKSDLFCPNCGKKVS